MPIELRTGLPGAGKTLGAVEHMMHLRKVSPERPLYVHGVTDLRDGIATELDADGVRNWKDLPAGAILVVDEAQKLMPSKRGVSESPQWIRDLSEHRHLGLDFIFVTQHPSLIDKYVRTLVDRHIHTVRVFGTSMIERWSWPICMQDPNAKGAKKDAESKTRHQFSKQAMSAYKSAELHTVQRRIPRFIYIAGALLVALPLFCFIGYKAMHHASAVAGAPGQQADSTGKGALSGTSAKAPMSKDEWIQRQLPRVAGIPWSAPIYDDQKVVAQPDLYCVKYEGPHGDECTCVTDQNTHATVPGAMCLQYAEGGVYNPYRSSIRTGGATANVSTSPAPAGGIRSASAQPIQNGAAPIDGGPMDAPIHTGGSMPGASWPAGVGASSYTAPGTPGSWNADAFGPISGAR